MSLVVFHNVFSGFTMRLGVFNVFRGFLMSLGVFQCLYGFSNDCSGFPMSLGFCRHFTTIVSHPSRSSPRRQKLSSHSCQRQWRHGFEEEENIWVSFVRQVLFVVLILVPALAHSPRRQELPMWNVWSTIYSDVSSTAAHSNAHRSFWCRKMHIRVFFFGCILVMKAHCSSCCYLAKVLFFFLLLLSYKE